MLELSSVVFFSFSEVLNSEDVLCCLICCEFASDFWPTVTFVLEDAFFGLSAFEVLFSIKKQNNSLSHPNLSLIVSAKTKIMIKFLLKEGH